MWGLFACAVAVWAAELGSLIEVVNRFGSFFYGSILGVFILAVAFPRATGNGAFVGLIAGMASVAWAASFTSIAFLWHNVIGAVAVVMVGMVVSFSTKPANETSDSDVGIIELSWHAIQARLEPGEEGDPEQLENGRRWRRT